MVRDTGTGPENLGAHARPRDFPPGCSITAMDPLPTRSLTNPAATIRSSPVCTSGRALVAAIQLPVDSTAACTSAAGTSPVAGRGLVNHPAGSVATRLTILTPTSINTMLRISGSHRSIRWCQSVAFLASSQPLRCHSRKYGNPVLRKA